MSNEIPERAEISIDSIPTVALRDPNHLVACLPYLLGFEPQRSLVIMGLAQSGAHSRLIVTARYDLPELTDVAGSREIVQHAEQALASIRDINSVLLVIVGETAGHVDRDQPYTALIDDLIYAFDDADIAVKDAVYTHEGSVHIYGCTDPSWPWHGVRISQEERDEGAAGFVFAGMSPATTREALYEEITRVADDLTADVARHIDTNEQSVQWIAPEAISALARDISGTLVTSSQMSAREVARMGVAFENVRIRDAVLWDLAHTSSQERLAARANLVQATRHLPDEHVAQVATVLGIEQWMSGDGARANIAVERALSANPDNSMARMLEQSLRMGMPPAVFAEMFTNTLTREVCTGEATHAAASRDEPAAAIGGPDTAVAL